MSADAASAPLSDLEARFLALWGLAALGASFEQAEAQVHTFLEHPALAGLCRLAAARTARQPQERRDLAHAALLHLLHQLRTGFGRARPLLGYRPEAGRGKFPFAGWLYTVLRNACRDASDRLSRPGRRERAAPALLTLAPARTDSSVELRDQVVAMTRAIDALPDEPRLVLLGYLAGKSGNELAREMGRSAVWVSRQKTRGIDLLRRALNREEG